MVRLAAVWALLVLVAAPVPGGAAEVVPGDVFAVVRTIATDLERLRHHMGVRKAEPLGLVVQGAAPHDVYFQARTLFTKANRLSFETVRIQDDLPPAPRSESRPSDVLELVSRTHTALQLVLSHFGVAGESPRYPREPERTPSDVFAAIVEANRQLNLLLERRFTPGDVYMQVTIAVGYAARLLARHPGLERIPEEPPFEAAKVPADVYLRLLGCLDVLSSIYRKAALEDLEIDTGGIDRDRITPSDVFDLASLVVARLDHTHRSTPGVRPPMNAYHPGRKIPADVYQRAGVLEAQLRALAEAGLR